MKESEISHYDSVASALLTVSATMIAIICGLVPFLKAQGAIGSNTRILFSLSLGIIVLVFTTSLLGLVAKGTGGKIERKRKFCVVSVLLLFVVVGVLIFSVWWLP